MNQLNSQRGGLDNCPVCDLPAARQVRSADVFHYICKRCGKYSISRQAFHALINADLSERQKANWSGWLNANQDCIVDEGQAERLNDMPNISFNERADKLLIAFEGVTTHAGEWLSYNEEWISWGWCLNFDELREVLSFMVQDKRVFQQPNVETYKIAPNGWAHIEDLRKKGADSQQGFVAMWFNDGMKPLYDNVISKAIEDAGYKPHRVDQRDHNGKIDDEIITQIRRSRFVVADFTGHRGGVYYEAGFAKGLGLEVIWTCRDDAKNDLHFDIRQYNCIFWEDGKPDEFQRQLANRIESVLGRGTGQAK